MKTFVILFAAVVCCLVAINWRSPEREFRFNHENVLGTSLELKIHAVTERAAEDAEAVALAEVDRLDGILSSYKTNSEFSKWQVTYGQDVKVSDELFEVLSLFDDWTERTNGVLTPAIGVASMIWKDASRTGSLPSTAELQRAVQRMNTQHWKLDATMHTARRISREPLVLNTFVKSYIINKVATAAMKRNGVTGVVVNIGGDIVVAGEYPERIAVSDPEADAENDLPASVITVRNGAVATSGNYRRGYMVDGQWYSHIIDPRTAYPATSASSATVVADNATDAGALATVFNILDPMECDALTKALGSAVKYRIQNARGNVIESLEWKSIETATGTTVNKPNGDFEMTVELELAEFSGRVRRPFVAVWIENKKKESVRNLALWYNKPRWLPDLKRWYSKNYDLMNNDIAGSITSATRSPGKYSLRFDGLDDNGTKLPNGTYTIYIEAAREHGTYQLIRQDFDWNGKQKHMDVKGGVEIVGASLDIHKTK